MNGSCRLTFAESSNKSNKNGKHLRPYKNIDTIVCQLFYFHFIYSQHKKIILLILTFFPLFFTLFLSLHTKRLFDAFSFYIFINMQTNPKHVVCIISLFIGNFFINILNKSFLSHFVNEMNFFNGIVTFIHRIHRVEIDVSFHIKKNVVFSELSSVPLRRFFFYWPLGH